MSGGNKTTHQDDILYMSRKLFTFIIAEKRLQKESCPGGHTAYLQEFGGGWEVDKREFNLVCNH